MSRAGSTNSYVWMPLELNTILVSAALVASSINTLITTFLLFHQINEKVRLAKAIHGLTRVVAKFRRR
jgi:hypothetical protein